LVHGLMADLERRGIDLPPGIKRAFLNLQIAILENIISNDIDAREADAYRKLSRLILSIQKDYAELFNLYKQTKKPLSAATEQEQQNNTSALLYRFSRRV